jgi:hypothetical protein
MGAELRRVASLEPMGEARVRDWGKSESTSPNWWWKGWETMRIPRLVFALLLATIDYAASDAAFRRGTARRWDNFRGSAPADTRLLHDESYSCVVAEIARGPRDRDRVSVRGRPRRRCGRYG